MLNDVNILLINLNDNIDRKLHSLQQFTKCGLENQLHIINATNPIQVQQQKHNYISLQANNNIEKQFINDAILPTWGAVGCAISHCRCWNYIIENDLPYAMICEDDIEIVDIDNFLFTVNRAIMYHKNFLYDKSLPDLDKHSFNGNNLMTVIDGYILNTNTKIDRRIKTPFSHSHCYIINQECCRFFLHKLIPITHQIDYQIGFLADTNITDLYIYNIVNGGTKQSNQFYSDTQYMYLSLSSLKKILSTIPDEACERIYLYLPKKNKQCYQTICSNHQDIPIGLYDWYNNDPYNNENNYDSEVNYDNEVNYDSDYSNTIEYINGVEYINGIEINEYYSNLLIGETS